MLLGYLLVAQPVMLFFSTHHILAGKTLNCKLCLAVEHFDNALASVPFVGITVSETHVSPEYPIELVQTDTQWYVARAPPTTCINYKFKLLAEASARMADANACHRYLLHFIGVL